MFESLRYILFGRKPRPPAARPTAPIDCPSCSGLIAVDADPAFWICRGLPTRADVVRVLSVKLPKAPPPHVVEIKPCGWRDRAEGFGRDWW